MKWLILTCFVIHLGGRAATAAHTIPAIIFGPRIQYKSVAALQLYDGIGFLNILKKHATVDTIAFIVAEDQLSVEDLSHCKAPNGQTCFQGIQSIETKLYLPSVEDPTSVIEDATEVDIIDISRLSGYNFSESLVSQTGKYVLINFDDYNYADETISEKLIRHDRMITSFYKGFVSQNNRSIIVVFTGKRGAPRLRFAREALSPYRHFEAENATDATNSTNVTGSTNGTGDGFVWKTEPVLMYYISIGVNILSQKQRMDVTSVVAHGINEKIEDVDQANNVTTVEENKEISWRDAPAGANATNATNTQSVRQIIVTVYGNINQTFEFVITKSRGYWRANQFTWNDEPLFSNRPITAVNGYSFHCTPAIRLTGRNGTILIIWKGLQLQPKFIYVKGEHFTSFTDANDCVGFVSSGILSGMFVVFILLFILFIGITCLMDIKTNDRFENPTGPRLTFAIME